MPRTAPLAEQRVHLCETPERWRWQDWGAANSRENLFRLGGHPSWVQYAEFPACRRCARPMSFLLQLDSDLPLEGGGECFFGTGGLAYGFWCDGCRTSAWTWQCT